MRANDKFGIRHQPPKEVGYSVGAVYPVKLVTITLMRQDQEDKDLRSFLIDMTGPEAIDLGKQLIEYGTKVKNHK